MFKGSITSTTTVTANVNVPFNIVYNTNSNTAYTSSGNTISILKPGFYDVSGQLVVTDVAAGDISAQLYVNGEVVPEATSSATSAATTDFITLPIKDMLRVVSTLPTQIANISVQLSVNATVDSAVLIVERIH